MKQFNKIQKLKRTLSLMMIFTVLSTSYVPLVAQAEETSALVLPTENEDLDTVEDLGVPDVKNKKEQSLAEMFRDPTAASTEVIRKLFVDEKPLTKLIEIDVNARNSFFERLSQEELYHAIILYRYALLAEAIDFTSDKETAQQAELQEIVTKKLDQYVAIQLLFQESCKKNTSVEITEKQVKEWDITAFGYIAEKFKNVRYKDEAGEKEITNFKIYTDYLQASTELDIAEILGLFAKMDALSSDSKDRNAAVAAVYNVFYMSYGFIQTPDTEAPEIITPETNVPETEAPEVDTPEAEELNPDATLEELFKDEKKPFNVVISKLFEEAQPTVVLREMDKETRSVFYNRLSEEELYMFTQLYNHTFLSFVIEDIQEETKSTKKETDGFVNLYEELEIHNLKAGNPDEEQYEKWDAEAFEFLRNKIEKITSDEKENSVKDFETYVDYLQGITDIDVNKMLQYFNLMYTTTDEDTITENKSEFRKYLYSIYGYDEKKKKYIERFEDFDMWGEIPYTTFIISNDEKKNVKKNLPEKLTVYVEGESKSMKIPVTWACKEDIFTTSLDTYIYELVLPDGYKMTAELEAELKKTEDSAPRMPFIDIIITENGKGRAAQARGTFNKVLIKQSGMPGQHYWWIFVKVTNPNGRPTAFHRPSDEGVATTQTMDAGSWKQDGETYNFAIPIRPINGKYGSYVYNVGVEGTNIGARTFTFGSARIGGTYYWDLKHAVENSYNGATIYVSRSMVSHAMRTNNNLSIYPEGGNITYTSLEPDPDSASFFCLPHGSTAAPTWNFGGNGSHRLTFDDNNRSGTSVIGSSRGTINLKSGVRLTNSKTNGLYNDTGTTNVYAGAIVDNNRHGGVISYGTINIYGGDIYSNAIDGVRSQKAINISGGTIHDNGNGVTVGNAAACTFKMTGGSVYSNRDAGVRNVDGRGSINISGGSIYSNVNTGVDSLTTTNISSQTIIRNNNIGLRQRAGTGTVSGGSIYSNAAEGVVVHSGATASIKGGSIYSNYRGVYTDGTLTMSAGSITSNNAGTGSGAGIYNNGTVSISGGDVSSNKAGYGGALLNNTGKTTTITGGTFTNNTATYGGGFFNKGTQLAISGSVKINSNIASTNGGGIYNESGTLKVSNNTVNILSNKSSSNGGGIAVGNGTLQIAGGKVSNNTAGNYGGGIFISAGTVKDIMVTAQENTATNYGGGIFTQVDTPLSSCTITNNNAETQSGGGVYMNYKTLTITDCNISSNSAGNVGGGVATYQGAINFNSGSINSNTAGNHGGGAYVGGGGATFTMLGGEMNSNKTTKYYGGAIFNDSSCTVNIKGGSILNNRTTHGGAVFNNSNATLNVTGGSIYQNTANYGGAIFNQSGSSTCNVSGGTTYGNTGSTAGGGVYNENTAVMNMWGGDISSNISPLGSGIYQNGEFNIGGAIWINNNNDVYLLDNKVVTATSALTSDKTVAILTPADYSLGRVVAKTTYTGSKGSAVFEKFALTEKAPYLLRPGDYQSGSGKASTDVVLSRTYAINYDKNTTDVVTDMPANHTKFWYETSKIAALSPILSGTPFKGWNEDAAAETGSYQSSNTILASINKDMTLYAIWESRIKVTYVGNQPDTGTAKSEYVTKKDCDANGDYTLRKNSGYTNFTKKRNMFTGWGKTERQSEPDYPESKVNKISFDMLKLMSGQEQQSGSRKTRAASDGIPEVVLNGIWDSAPDMDASGVQEFYEGTTVTKEMLLKNIRAFDQVKDGDLTKKIRITDLEYSAGKLVNGVKQAAKKETWSSDMPADYKLDTWFLQLDKNDSPVTHKITYAVTDSAGNVTTLDWTIKVLYNEFPVIETEDRYFTLDEAQNGVITEELLTTDALTEGKLKVTDKEEDKLYPNTIASKAKLENFEPSEFTSFKESGFVVLTYAVQDSMGPEGNGKETLCQFTVHIVKDGEVVEPDAAKYVRFISQKYYEKNLGVDPSTLSDEEREERNHNGGLNVDSKWYHDPAYKAAISKMWDDAKEPDQIWKFTHEDVLKVKEYIEVYGIGNSQEQNALKVFIEQFKHTIQ